jgi:ABC-type transport system involved in multi-copper enzyme maturation permease subunit
MSDGQASTAVLWRESARTSRRWQTYALRAGFSGALLGILLLGIWASVAFTTQSTDLSDSAWMGRALFIAFTVMQMVISLFMAPMTTARAIAEERLEGTLDLLVLTPIRAGTLLAAKITSRLLVLLTVVLGSLPLMALVTTLGGVAITEVVLVTVGNGVTLVVLGVLGGWFGLFTRSPFVATLATTGWALMAFLALPGILALATASPAASAWVSPFFASAGDWWGLLLPLTWTPTVLMAWVLGARLFALKMARAELRRFFDGKLWGQRWVLIGGVAFTIASVTLLPVGVTLSWADFVSGAGGQPWLAWGGLAGRLLVWVWLQGLALLGTWFYLRLGMDLVDAFEGMLDQLGRNRERIRKSKGHRIWRNPVAWRETRVSGWGRGGLPLLIGWGLLLFAVLQTGLWILPGGLLTVGAANAAAALLLTCWLAAGAIEQERHGHSLDLLLVSRLSSLGVLGGKLLAVALPTLPLLAVSMPVLVLGFPHAALFLEDGAGQARALIRGILTSVWLLGFWSYAATLSMTVALRVKNPESAHGVAVAAVASTLLVPTFLGWVLGDWGLWALPIRLLGPVALPDARLYEILVSTLLFGIVSTALFLLLVVRLRHWGTRP